MTQFPPQSFSPIRKLPQASYLIRQRADRIKTTTTIKVLNNTVVDTRISIEVKDAYSKAITSGTINLTVNDKTQTVTISLEEYKELLLKDRPTDKDHEMLERIMREFEKHVVFCDSRWDSGFVGDNMKVEDTTEICLEIMRVIKYVDFDRYMKMWNHVQTTERKRKAMQEQIDQMNRAKAIREENEDAEDNE